MRDRNMSSKRTGWDPSARSSLFSGTRRGGRGGDARDETEQLLESANNERIEHLSKKTEILRGISVDLNKELKEQNTLLDEMESDMSRTRETLGGTVTKLADVMSMKSNQHMCYLVLCIVGVFFLVNWFRKW
eukprot:TRINITY_DN1518_c0_g1_i1.p1 TRINITY_DN1518_c0_g1~~TRINITY_DN1518_c0_g1_i1.p1  ORF type:complete len:132 (-),score=6.19 TRINITY_DN1518_c0_g1_i1:53-448(-)